MSSIYIRVKDVTCYNRQEDYDAEVAVEVDRGYYDSTGKEVKNRVCWQFVVGKHLSLAGAEIQSQESQALLVSLIEEVVRNHVDKYPAAKE